MKLKLLAISIFILALLISGCSHPLGSKGSLTNPKFIPTPFFNVTRTGNSTLQIIYVDTGGATSVKGLRIIEPIISNPEIISSDIELIPNQKITVTDLNLTSPAHIIVETYVSGTDIDSHWQVVMIQDI